MLTTRWNPNNVLIFHPLGYIHNSTTMENNNRNFTHKYTYILYLFNNIPKERTNWLHFKLWTYIVMFDMSVPDLYTPNLHGDLYFAKYITLSFNNGKLYSRFRKYHKLYIIKCISHSSRCNKIYYNRVFQVKSSNLSYNIMIRSLDQLK